MEVCLKSSWFLLLLGFALFAVTLQEPEDCPTSDQVSCTTGDKCNVDEDCDKHMICCSNPCYTKRCIPNTKGVQGGKESEGPSESECRPYIEKALKELETGEALDTHKESSEGDDSAEDIPTVEITDDSSHQEQDAEGEGDEHDADDGGNESDETTEPEIPMEKAVEAEAIQENSEEAADDKKSDETADKSREDKDGDDNSKEDQKEPTVETETQQSEEQQETTVSDEQQGEEEDLSKEDQKESIEEVKEESEEDHNVKEVESTEENAESVENQASEETQSVEGIRVVAKEGAGTADRKESAEQQEQADAKSHESEENEEETQGGADDSAEEEDNKVESEEAEGPAVTTSDETKEESVEEADEKETEEDREESAEEKEKESAEKHDEESAETKDDSDEQSKDKDTTAEESKEDDTVEAKSIETSKEDDTTDEVRDTKSGEEQEETAKDAESEEKSEEATGNCSPADKISCQAGASCSKTSECSEGEICCPNKCYRKQCVPPAPESDEDDSKVKGAIEETEDDSNESDEVLNCPSSDKIACGSGEKCGRNKDCVSDQICCPNKCYRKQCVSPAPESEQDDSKVKGAIEETEDDSDESDEVLNCPSSDKIACGSGEKCGRNKDCVNGQICCSNKCYRKQCVSPAPESDKDDSDVTGVVEETEDDSVESDEVSKCPSSDKIACGSGEKCGRNKDCVNGQICCSNKCYRKQCVAPAEDEDEDEKEEKVAIKATKRSPESKEKEQEESEESEEETKCPPSDQITCTGEKCGDNNDCDSGEVCCPNKCYRKQCVPPVEESEEEISSKNVDTQERKKIEKAQPEPELAVSKESEEESECPPLEEVPCNAGQRCLHSGDCSESQVCCPNRCYRKECVASTGLNEESAEEKPIITEKKKEVKVKIVEVKVVKRVPVPVEEIKKIPTKKVTREVKRKEESKEDDDASIETVGDAAVEDLSLYTDIPTNLRSRDHVEHLLKLDREFSETEDIINKVSEITLKELKKLYENAIKPLEVLYKYRDLSNRHFGDAEIFSKPLILFMGPWSGGKSSIINYLVNNEYNETSLRTGAEPSPAYFNILMYGEEPEIIDGTELAADFTFSGLQKFGQGLEERLRGVKLPSKLLEKVNIVEIPGILEVRKQVSRLFPFNDACQWFIDRADIIFLVYDPSKLDVGPETEAILDQLKGREHQTRIVLNKADQVKPEELMRVQGALIWNISPLMSSPQPPVMYTTSLWSRPFEPWAPMRLLQAQERAFLRDLRTAVEKRIENKIASARRFAVRVRNHAKMVDCYLTTYYNHKSVFGNRKQVANEIIEHPQDYHIYEGLSTLTNISRYDLPDPDVYKYFFKLNPLYDFQQLSATCTYFRGCPINRLDIAIAYDLPELVGTHKKNLEEALATGSAPQQPVTPGS